MSAVGAGPGSELDDEETTRSILKEAEAAGLPAGTTAEELRNYVTFAQVVAKRGCGRPAPYGGVTRVPGARARQRCYLEYPGARPAGRRLQRPVTWLRVRLP